VKWSTQQATRRHPVVIFWAMSPAGTAPSQTGLAGCSKRPDFSPAQPWRAKSRLPPSKAATLRLTLVSRLTFHGSWERRENDAGGLL